MFIKKTREFTGLWVFDKWKGYLSNSVLLEKSIVLPRNNY